MTIYLTLHWWRGFDVHACQACAFVRLGFVTLRAVAMNIDELIQRGSDRIDYLTGALVRIHKVVNSLSAEGREIVTNRCREVGVDLKGVTNEQE